MKRLTALLLALLLMLAATPALAADNYTIEEIFYRQAMLKSAYQGTLTLEVTGEGTSAVEPSLWNALKAIAPRVALEVSHCFADRQQEGQATLTLKIDGQKAGETVFLYNDKLMGLTSVLLGGEGVYYTADREWDVLEWLRGAVMGDSAWPPMLAVIASVAAAPQEWQDRAAAYLIPYETKLGIWLNGYASFQTGTDENGVAYTEMDFTIPALAVKAEIKQLLVDFYGNLQLLTLLREVVPAREAQAYLDPGMLNSFLLALDGLKLEGQIEIIRRYDGQGQSLMDEVRLPFGEGQALTRLTLSSHHTAEGVQWHFRGQTAGETDFDIACLTAEEGICTGSVELILPEEEQPSFVVDDGGEPDRRTVAFDFNLMWDPGEESYSLAADRNEHPYHASLLVKPRGENAGPTQALTLEAKFSGRDTRSSTRLDATLEWRDVDAGASVKLTLDSRTVSPFAVQSLDRVIGAVRLDQLDDAGRQALLERWMANGQTYLLGLAARLALNGLK